MSAEWLVMHGHALLCAVDAGSAPEAPADMRAIDANLDFRFSSLLPAGTRAATRGARARFDFGLPPERMAGATRPTPAQLAAPRSLALGGVGIGTAIGGIGRVAHRAIIPCTWPPRSHGGCSTYHLRPPSRAVLGGRRTSRVYELPESDMSVRAPVLHT